MLEEVPPGIRSAAATKARIVAAAQRIFAEKGFSHAGMREIAREAGVATSLLTKYFKHKTKLFEAALLGALVPPEVVQADRAGFGKAVVGTVLDRRELMQAPAMMALSVGDAEARAVVMQVAREYVLAAMIPWLGAPQEQARAVSILMMCLGFSLFSRDMKLTDSAQAEQETAEMFAAALQRIVDMT